LKEVLGVKIAIPTDDGKTVASHFGRAEYFMIVELQDGKEIARRLSENLHARGHGHHGHHGHHEEHENHEGYGHGWHHGNHGYGEGHHHGHEDVFASTGEIQAVIAVRIGPHMFEDLKERGIEIYLVRPGTDIDEAISKLASGQLRRIEPKR
jgi:predicted Fe-Mo cluster-binding NifX family protein